MFYNKRAFILLCAATIMLFISFIEKQFSNEISWDSKDYILAAILLVGTGFASEISLRKIGNKRNKIILLIALFISLFLILAELSVGIFGSSFARS